MVARRSEKAQRSPSIDANATIALDTDLNSTVFVAVVLAVSHSHCLFASPFAAHIKVVKVPFPRKDPVMQRAVDRFCLHLR